MQGTIHFGSSPAGNYVSVDRPQTEKLLSFLKASGKSPQRLHVAQGQSMVTFTPISGELHQLPRRFREFCISNEAAQ